MTLISTEKLDVCNNVTENGVLLHCFLCNSPDLKLAESALLCEKLLLHASLYIKSYHEFLCTLPLFILLL